MLRMTEYENGPIFLLWKQGAKILYFGKKLNEIVSVRSNNVINSYTKYGWYYHYVNHSLSAH